MNNVCNIIHNYFFIISSVAIDKIVTFDNFEYQITYRFSLKCIFNNLTVIKTVIKCFGVNCKIIFFNLSR